MMGPDIKKLVDDFEKRKPPGRVIDLEPIFQKAEIDIALRAANAASYRKKELLKLKPGALATFEPATVNTKYDKHGVALRRIHNHLEKKAS